MILCVLRFTYLISPSHLGCGDLGPFHGMAATVLWSFDLCLLALNVKVPRCPAGSADLFGTRGVGCIL